MDDAELRSSLEALHSASYGWANVCCGGDRELAEEVLQSTYVSLLNRPTGFAGRSTFRTWLFAAIRKTALDHRRGRWWSRVVRLDVKALRNLADSASLAPPAFDADDAATAIRAALVRLPGRQREAVHLVFYQGLSLTEAARVMNVSVGAARQHYARAKNVLKQLLREFNDCEESDARPVG